MTADKYKKANIRIFNEFKQSEDLKNEIIVIDGVINTDIFFSSETRPLFLLKEAYGKDETNNDIAKEHNCNFGEDCDQRHKTWPNISRWTYALFNTSKDRAADYIELDCFGKKKNEYLQKTAVINVKKCSGKSASKYHDLRKYAVKYSHLLKEQIENIEPTVIVCGYTLSLLKKIIPDEIKPHTRQLKEKHYAIINLNKKDVIVLDCYHPANRTHSPKQLFDLIANIYQEALS